MAKVVKKGKGPKSQIWVKVKEEEQNCGNCQHFCPYQGVDSAGKPLGICLNIESPFKTNYRVEENFCIKFESKKI